jgi:hypothetical protein
VPTWLAGHSNVFLYCCYRRETKREERQEEKLPVFLACPTASTLFEVPGHQGFLRLMKSFALHSTL